MHIVYLYTPKTQHEHISSFTQLIPQEHTLIMSQTTSSPITHAAMLMNHSQLNTGMFQTIMPHSPVSISTTQEPAKPADLTQLPRIIHLMNKPERDLRPFPVTTTVANGPGQIHLPQSFACFLLAMSRERTALPLLYPHSYFRIRNECWAVFMKSLHRKGEEQRASLLSAWKAVMTHVRGQVGYVTIPAVGGVRLPCNSGRSPRFSTYHVLSYLSNVSPNRHAWS